eukprot:CAMPEP_0113967952 /NCGR_PEP_ID=MMETSP0011_2-20120614/9233_1 /TAXON_ID=101924 /ORGANISM="Rhodosorus marinus" /LENGTH=556 /DNA_ID=CAMNT_0000980927 /DNA_START=322 /DNA_END=1989 /DNA_ORIENTATION=- /assembly_acc=CAM_ASM_000156
MLQEVIYSLAGFTGDVVFEDPAPSASEAAGLKLADGVPILEKSERATITRVLKLGSAARDLQYLRDVGCDSLYLSSVFESAGAIIEKFQEDLLDIERRAGLELLTGATSLELALRSWEAILPEASDCMRGAFERKLSGPDVLHYIQARSSRSLSNPSILRMYRLLINGCEATMRVQLLSWLLYGDIIDPNDEFFIEVAGDGGKAPQVREERLPAWMESKNAHDLLYAGQALAEMRQRKHEIKIDFGQHVDAVVAAGSEFAMAIAVSRLKNRVSEEVGTLVPPGSIKELLSSIRDYPLLGRGLLWDLFIEEVDKSLNIEAGVRIAEELGFENVTFSSFNGVTSPCLSPPWPLSEVVTSEQEQLYADVFTMLLSVRKAGKHVNSAWLAIHRHGLLLCRQRLHDKTEHRLQLLFQALRARMGILLENLMFYFQIDVVESYMSGLSSQLEESSDSFPMAVKLHKKAIIGVYTECLVGSRVISSCLVQILEQVESFTSFVSQRERSWKYDEEPDLGSMLEGLEKLERDFMRSSGLLFELLSSVKSVEGSSNLARLILRLDW